MFANHAVRTEAVGSSNGTRAASCRLHNSDQQKSFKHVLLVISLVPKTIESRT